MTRIKFAFFTIGLLGVYLVVILFGLTYIPALNFAQPDAVSRFIASVLHYSGNFALWGLLFLMAYTSPALFSPNTSTVLFYAAFYAVVILWIWAEFQRLRYLRHSGWWFLLNFIPYIAVGFYLYLLFRPSPIADPDPTFESENGILKNKEEGYCPDCGTPRRTGKFYCPKCGHKFVD